MTENAKILWLWDDDNKVYVKAQCDENGYLKVDMSEIGLTDLADVTIAGLADGHFLSYSAGLGYWQNRLLAEADIPAAIATELDGLADVNAPAPADNESLTFDIGTGLWIPELAEPAVHGIAKHTDVTRTLFVPCGNFYNGTPGQRHSHDSIKLATGVDQGVFFEFMTPSDLVVDLSLKVVWLGMGGVVGQDWVCDPTAYWGKENQSSATVSSTPANTVIDVAGVSTTFLTLVGFTIGAMEKGHYVGVGIVRLGTDVLDTYAGGVFLRGLLLSYTAEQ